MTDAQIIAIAITVLAVLAGSIFNNVRISDSASAVNKRFDDVNARFSDVNRHIDDVKEVLRAEMKALEARMENRFNSIDHKLDEILRIIGDHETRISALEHRPR